MRKMYQKNGRNLETLTFSTLATANNTILGSNDHTISQSGYMTVAYLLHTGSGPVAGHENLTCSSTANSRRRPASVRSTGTIVSHLASLPAQAAFRFACRGSEFSGRPHGGRVRNLPVSDLGLVYKPFG